ncbi:DNA cytosine methyltransferase [Enterobacter hormaechei subsp. steigerwaltii]|uniref:DNA cytosine methyltransferase n=1 Tax=Enterobacter hormaechei TaxID=158836 RepID=UPI001D094ED1|nr:DNA cytosine methyltransferase [Enterobacter hormaechei]MCU2413949.1 DNA cytosine methyltransferase [Enterobacter hormaechei subsp. steigerwaltii]HCJ7328989.1 DNA cytosine methyltransferase [Enterobacter hormaechei subsp. xiangfangensis]ELD3407699.1 DNA cytosine methyltransferase [Enterobacter hormaechei]MCU2975527.1 DNA cytosine methyltransferase [Enterobacter hormaechei subsp. steigerwaltii]MCU3093590.1 DNA cytosine methyltransferase [Enterobacter hormaechei subsp. steigerwaltii]
MKPAAYYNEIDQFAAQWLRNLIAGGHIAPGEVDERSIEDVTPDDLRGFTQCHFFAGIGVWSHSLRLSGWPDDKPVWTGSCPCQPFSAAGKGDGFADERHLWPHFFHLISERRPQHVFGEQVASGNANVWFDLVQSDLEGMGYAFGLVPFTSASIGAPHIRERAYWVAESIGEQCQKLLSGLAKGNGSEGGRTTAKPTGFCRTNSLAYSNNRVGDEGETLRPGRDAVLNGCINGRPLEVNGFWRDADWLFCRDEKWRPVEPGTFPLVDGAAARLGRVEPGVARVASSNRVGRLKGYGNAINAQAAAEFVRAYMGVSYGR